MHGEIRVWYRWGKMLNMFHVDLGELELEAQGSVHKTGTALLDQGSLGA
jgi:hypothetical protein